MKITKKLIARSRLRYSQGSAMVGIVIALTTLLTFANVFQPTFEKLGIPIWIIYILLPIGYVGLCWYVGMLYDTKGFWEEETSHANEFLNPEFSRMIDDIGKIKKSLEEIREQQKRIETRMVWGNAGSMSADDNRSCPEDIPDRV